MPTAFKVLPIFENTSPALGQRRTIVKAAAVPKVGVNVPVAIPVKKLITPTLVPLPVVVVKLPVAGSKLVVVHV